MSENAAKELTFMREIMEKSSKSRIIWDEKYGRKYGGVSYYVDASQKPNFLNKNEKKKSKEEEDEELQRMEEDIKSQYQNELTTNNFAKFAGGYVPKQRDQFSPVTKSVLEATLTSQLSKEDRERMGDGFSKQHFRKADWMKTYHEELTKIKAISKLSGSAKEVKK